MTQRLRDELKRDEGVRKEAYLDTNGFWTIGVGHLLGRQTFSGARHADGRPVNPEPRMLWITDAEVDALLDADLQVAAHAVMSVFNLATIDIGDSFAGVRGRALINMAFNRGETNMRNSSTITPAIKDALAAGVGHDIAWNKVGEAIRRSPWGKQIGQRAERLARAFESGEAQ